MTKIDL